MEAGQTHLGRAVTEQKLAKDGSRRGGARAGAGRPLGARTYQLQRRADQYAKDGGVLPVDVMVGTMRALWDDATLGEVDAKGRRRILKAHQRDRRIMKEAHEIAKDLAPYLHPKLSAMEVGGPGGGPLELLVKRATTSLQSLSQTEFDTLMGIMQKLGLVSMGDSDPLKNGNGK